MAENRRFMNFFTLVALDKSCSKGAKMANKRQKLTHFIIDVDSPLKNGFPTPFVSKVNFRSCLLSLQSPLNVNLVFLV